MDKKASLAKRVFHNNHPGKEAKDGPVFSRSGCGGSPARRPVLCRIASTRSYPESLRCGKIVLARLGVFARGNRMGLSLAMPQPGPFLPRRRGPADCLAFVARCCAMLGRHRSLLYGARRFAGGSLARLGARDWQAGGGRIAASLALARTKGSGRRRVYSHHARHAGEPGGLSATENAEARLWLSHCPNPGGLFALGGHGAGGGDREIPRQADRRKTVCFRTLYDALAEGDIILADRYFSGWSDIALPLGRGIDFVVRKHQARRTDFRTGKRLARTTT